MKGKNAKSTASRTIKWHDHASESNWQSLEDVKKWVEHTKKNPCVTKGTVVYEDKDVIVLTDGHDGNGNFGNTSLIFKKLIV
ncbi:MAG: hypothetical protein AAB875_01335 [Patescibacteria group bacterium]